MPLKLYGVLVWPFGCTASAAICQDRLREQVSDELAAYTDLLALNPQH